MRKAFVVAGIGLASMLALGPLGCSGGGGASKRGLDQSPEAEHIAKAAAHVVNYLALPENRQRKPKDTSDKNLKDWAAKNKIQEHELASTRDHEPYQIHELSPGRGVVTIITETTGVNGKKYMFIHGQGRAGVPGAGKEVTQEEIDKAVQPTGTGSGTGRRGGGRPGRPG
jgi:hypothetical protein